VNPKTWLDTLDAGGGERIDVELGDRLGILDVERVAVVVEEVEALLDHELDRGRAGRVLGHRQGVDGSGGLVDVVTGAGGPVVLEVAPGALDGPGVHLAVVVVLGQHRAGGEPVHQRVAVGADAGAQDLHLDAGRKLGPRQLVGVADTGVGVGAGGVVGDGHRDPPGSSWHGG
jgi:hypothetical protein